MSEMKIEDMRCCGNCDYMSEVYKDWGGHEAWMVMCKRTKRMRQRKPFACCRYWKWDSLESFMRTKCR